MRHKHLPCQAGHRGGQFHAQHAPQIVGYDDPPTQGFALWVAWNKLVLKAEDHPGYVFGRLEDDPTTRLARMAFLLGHEPTREQERAAFAIPSNVGSSGSTARLSADDCKDDGLRRELRNLAHRFGYTI